MAKQKAFNRGWVVGTCFGQGSRDAARLQAAMSAGCQLGPRGVKLRSRSRRSSGAGTLLDPAVIDELFQDPRKRLLGYFQDFEQIGDAEAGMARDEVQNAMMGAS